jgi:hypothetical protein
MASESNMHMGKHTLCDTPMSPRVLLSTSSSTIISCKAQLSKKHQINLRIKDTLSLHLKNHVPKQMRFSKREKC